MIRNYQKCMKDTNKCVNKTIHNLFTFTLFIKTPIKGLVKGEENVYIIDFRLICEHVGEHKVNVDNIEPLIVYFLISRSPTLVCNTMQPLTNLSLSYLSFVNFYFYFIMFKFFIQLKVVKLNIHIYIFREGRGTHASPS